MTLICGVEEAGRGPVIGPMVMCGILIEEKDIAKLKNIKVKDSKMLTPLQRESMFNKILAVAKSYHVITITPEQIDLALNSADLNLNWLEAITSAKIINELKPNQAILDCPSNNIQAYKDYVTKLLNVDAEIIAEHKADEKYPVVSAASIIAKVIRDQEIKEIHKKYNINFGSGYPSDPKTKEFIQKNHDKYPEIFRKTWATYKKIAENKNQKSLKQF